MGPKDDADDNGAAVSRSYVDWIMPESVAVALGVDDSADPLGAN